MKQILILLTSILLLVGCTRKQDGSTDDYIKFDTPFFLLNVDTDPTLSYGVYNKLKDSLQSYKFTESNIVADTIQFLNVINLNEDFSISPYYQVTFSDRLIQLNVYSFDSHDHSTDTYSKSINSVPKVAEPILLADFKDVTNRIINLIANISQEPN